MESKQPHFAIILTLEQTKQLQDRWLEYLNQTNFKTIEQTLQTRDSLSIPLGPEDLPEWTHAKGLVGTYHHDIAVCLRRNKINPRNTLPFCSDEMRTHMTTLMPAVPLAELLMQLELSFPRWRRCFPNHEAYAHAIVTQFLQDACRVNPRVYVFRKSCIWRQPTDWYVTITRQQ